MTIREATGAAAEYVFSGSNNEHILELYKALKKEDLDRIGELLDEEIIND